MAKKSKKSYTKHQQHRAHKLHKIILGLSAVVAAIIIAVVLVLTIIPTIHNQARLHRINEIYSSIKLPENQYFKQSDIFGDKRPYDYDKSRSKSSYEQFVVAQNVDTTFNQIDGAIKAAGYTQIKGPESAAVIKEAQYKTPKSEYIRLTVSSKLRDDAGSNEILMTGKFSDDFFKIDPNAGPSRVTLKVNLDDNNE